jgi:hypothetical protein
MDWQAPAAGHTPLQAEAAGVKPIALTLRRRLKAGIAPGDVLPKRPITGPLVAVGCIVTAGSRRRALEPVRAHDVI